MGKNILFEKSYDPTNNDFCVVKFKNFNKLISVHDFRFSDFENQTKINNKITEMIKKYKRRRERFFKTIKENNKIFFLRYCSSDEDLESEQIFLFVCNILSINNKLQFYIVIITTNTNLNIPQHISKYIIVINLNDIPENLPNNNLYDEIIRSYKYVYEVLKKPISDLIYSNPNDCLFDEMGNLNMDYFYEDDVISNKSNKSNKLTVLHKFSSQIKKKSSNF
jgi:hypothetical protein